MIQLAATSRPMLVSHARYRWDKIREQHQIVFPEGMRVLNDSGAEIMKRLNGRSLAELVAELERSFETSGLEPDVRDFLEDLRRKGLLRDAADA